MAGKRNTSAQPKAQAKQEAKSKPEAKRKRAKKTSDSDALPVLSEETKAKYQKQWQTMMDTGTR